MTERNHVTRRQWVLAAAGTAAASLAGCLGGDGGGDGDDGSNETENGSAQSDATEAALGGSDQNPEDQLEATKWPMHAVDPQSTGYHPTASGPTGDVQVRWEFESEELDPDASPVVADGTAFLGSDGSPLWAIDLDDGELRWEAHTEYEGHTSIDGSPVLNDGTIFVPWSRYFIALDTADGTQQWSKLYDDDSIRLPVFYDGAIYAMSGGSNYGKRILRYDPETGERTVVFELEDGEAFSSLSIHEGLAYFTENDEVVAVDLETEAVDWRWTHPEGDDVDSSGVAVDDGRVYTTAGNVGYGSDQPGVFALDAETGEVDWRFTPDTPQLRRPPAVADGTVFAGDHSTWAIDAASGEELWSRDEDCFTKPVVADGTVYVWGSKARAVDTATGDLLWEFDEKPAGTDFGEGATIVVTDGIALLATYSKLIALEAAD